MQYELTGKLFEIFDTIQRTEKFKVREFIVESKDGKDGQFTNYVKFQASNERTSVLDNMSIGDEVKVHFNIKGSKWEKDGKVSYFVNLDAWKIEQLSKAAKKEFIEEAELVEPVDDLPF
jgi:hypothetical protein